MFFSIKMAISYLLILVLLLKFFQESLQHLSVVLLSILPQRCLKVKVMTLQLIFGHLVFYCMKSWLGFLLSSIKTSIKCFSSFKKQMWHSQTLWSITFMLARRLKTWSTNFLPRKKRKDLELKVVLKIFLNMSFSKIWISICSSKENLIHHTNQKSKKVS